LQVDVARLRRLRRTSAALPTRDDLALVVESERAKCTSSPLLSSV
jgi:hypothetical protein